MCYSQRKDERLSATEISGPTEEAENPDDDNRRTNREVASWTSDSTKSMGLLDRRQPLAPNQVHMNFVPQPQPQKGENPVYEWPSEYDPDYDGGHEEGNESDSSSFSAMASGGGNPN